MLIFLAAVLLAAAVFFAGEVVTYPARQRHRSLRRAADYGRVRIPGNGIEMLRFRERVLAPATNSLARLALRLNPRTTMESIQLALLSAGLNRNWEATRAVPLPSFAARAGPSARRQRSSTAAGEAALSGRIRMPRM